MPPFPLLRLPRLVLCEIFKSLNIGEKVNLSLCSKKTSTRINNARLYSQKVNVHLDMANEKIEMFSEDFKDWFQIGIHLDNEIDSLTIQSFSIGRCTLPMSKTINTYWKNLVEGFLCLIRQLLKMFYCNISTDRDCWRSDLFEPIIFELFDLKVEFKTLTIRINGLNDGNLLWNQISRDLKSVEDLIIVSLLPSSFRPVFTSWPQNVTITSSDWFTLKSLLTCTCTTITLLQSNLGNNDLNELLKKWKAGGFPNLEYLRIHSQYITYNRTTILRMDSNELAGMIIQTDDESKKTTLKIRDRCFEMSVEMS